MIPMSRMDRVIGEYILCHEKNEFHDVLSEDERLEVAYYLSELPNGLLGWYPFDRAGRVLQIGSWFGAFTEMLCSRCKDVTVVEADPYRAHMTGIRLKACANLKVIKKNVAEYCRECGRKFQYIIFAVDENVDIFPDIPSYKEVLEATKSVLAKEGKLLFISPNRFGTKYFCGEPDPNTKIRFDGMTENNSGLYRFDRQELLDFTDSLGFPYVKMYYPMPDHHHTQMVYTDECRPGPDMRERLYIYVSHKTKRLLDEWFLVERLAKNGMMHFFTNTFFAEMGNVPCSKVIYSAISAERARERAFATNIMENGIVEKVPLYQEGYAGIKQLFANTRELSERGISVLEMKEEGEHAVMPYVRYPSFSQYLQDIVKKDLAQFFSALDCLYEKILCSSEHVAADRNIWRESAPQEDWGVILRKAYLEMIPVNSFWNKGEILFYDQEFTKENCPANYVLFRALRDLYHLSLQIEKFCPLDVLKERYGLTATWKYYEEEEERFQTELRRRNIYSGFFHWLRYLFDIVDQNRRQMEEDEEREYFHPFSNLDCRRIILFGAGRLTDYYLESFGTELQPVFIVDNDSDKWGKRKEGIEIKNPDTILKLMQGTYRVIIAVKDYEPIAMQLEKMGVGADSYRIFHTKIASLLKEKIKYPMSNGKYEIGYVPGKFDTFGIKDLQILEQCKRRCHCLVVGVYAEEAIRKTEGKSSVFPVEERMEIVRQCKYTDRVIPVDQNFLDEIEMWDRVRYGCLFLPKEALQSLHTIWLQRKLRTLGAEVEFFRN